MRVERLTDPNVIRAFLNPDRGQNAYMLGDLAEPYWSDAHFYGAFTEAELHAIVLKYLRFDPPPTITAGETEGVRAVLEHLAHVEQLPSVMYHALPQHLPIVGGSYDTSASIAMWRMIVTPECFQLPAGLDQARRLTPADATSAGVMYAADGPRDAVQGEFYASLFEESIFYGVEEQGQIVAAAGTHIVSTPERIGAIGFVFTHPNMRGRGYATLCTGAVTQVLFKLGINLVALNVRQENPPAIRAYERLGYVRHAPLYEGVGQRLAV